MSATLEAPRTSQRTALKEILSDGQSHTMDDLVFRVEDATGKPAERASLTVLLSRLRSEDGINIVTKRGPRGTATTYRIAGSKGRRRK